MAHDDDSEAKASSIEAAYKQFDADFLSAMNQAKKNCIKSPQTDGVQTRDDDQYSSFFDEDADWEAPN